MTIALDRGKILTTGRKAVEAYLQKLHIYKSTADFEAGSKLYSDMTTVDPKFWGTDVRNEVLRNKQPRKVFVQANTVLEEASGKVELKEYDASVEGMIKSYAERDVWVFEPSPYEYKILLPLLFAIPLSLLANVFITLSLMLIAEQ